MAELIVDQRIQGVTLSGSSAAGRAVAEQSGPSLKKTVLELGGSDPFIVLDDTPVDTVAAAAATEQNQNSGNRVSRVNALVHEDVSEAFVKEVKSL